MLFVSKEGLRRAERAGTWDALSCERKEMGSFLALSMALLGVTGERAWAGAQPIGKALRRDHMRGWKKSSNAALPSRGRKGAHQPVRLGFCC